MAEIVDTAGSITGCRKAMDLDSRLPNYPMFIWGIGKPEGSITAMVGTIYIDLEGVPGQVMWVKETGIYPYTKTGWRNK